MPIKNETPTKFKPERPIILHESNTGFKTQDEVVFAIEKLREKGWLCTYGEKLRPFHMSFNNEKEFQEFKKTCSQLSITLKSPIIKEDDILQMDSDDALNEITKETTITSSYEDPDGKVHIE